MTSQSHDLPIPEPTSVYSLDAVGFGHVKINNIRYEKLQKTYLNKRAKDVLSWYTETNKKVIKKSNSPGSWITRVVTI